MLTTREQRLLKIWLIKQWDKVTTSYDEPCTKDYGENVLSLGTDCQRPYGHHTLGRHQHFEDKPEVGSFFYIEWSDGWTAQEEAS